MDSEVLTIAQELAEVTRLADVDDVPATLERYVSRVVRTVPGCDRACISIPAQQGSETIAGAWDGMPAEPTRGPAMTPVDEVLRHREPRRLDDIDADRRWPAFVAQMRAAGYRSCLSLPLAVAQEPSAAFTLLSCNAGQFGSASYDLVLLFALHAGPTFDNASLYHDASKLVEQLRTSLVTRTTIGQAQGLLMHRFGYDADASFGALREASQNHNIKLRDLATMLIEGHDERALEDIMSKFGVRGSAPAQS